MTPSWLLLGPGSFSLRNSCLLRSWNSSHRLSLPFHIARRKKATSHLPRLPLPLCVVGSRDRSSIREASSTHGVRGISLLLALLWPSITGLFSTLCVSPTNPDSCFLPPRQNTRHGALHPPAKPQAYLQRNSTRRQKHTTRCPE